jgi:hypothetical protein
MVTLMKKRKIEYQDKNGKPKWFWSTAAKRAWERALEWEAPDCERLFLLKNRAWVLERCDFCCNEYGELEDRCAIRELNRDEAYAWLVEHQQIGPTEQWPSEIRDLAEGDRAKRPRTPPREVKGKIEQYLAEHARDLQEFRKSGDTDAARPIFGRNAVARACGLSHSAVGSSQQWREVAETLRLVT